jgi:VIT1/CCC1 family predicted Fe2+/Mn2+ transporter
MNITPDVRQKLLAFQKNEITEYHIYSRLAKTLRSLENRRILENIANDERRHYEDWKRYTQEEVLPDRWKIWRYYWISRIFGITFGIKLMENGEEGAQESYHAIQALVPEAAALQKEEHDHENMLIGLIDEERLRYTGSMVLGLNDALVELTGALAGLTLALQNTTLVALTGSITGIAAAFSMAASEYLSTKSEETAKSPVKAAVYTGIAYIFTVLALILPYLIFKSLFVCLAFTLIIAIMIIALFNYYFAVAKSVPFKPRFLEMTGLSLAVAALSFLIGFLMRTLFGIEV